MSPFINFQTAVPVAAWLAPVFLLRFARSQRLRIAMPALANVNSMAMLVALRNGFFPFQYGTGYYVFIVGIGVPGRGEQGQVLGGTRGQPVGSEGGPAGEKEALRGRQGEELTRHLDLERFSGPGGSPALASVGAPFDQGSVTTRPRPSPVPRRPRSPAASTTNSGRQDQFAPHVSQEQTVDVAQQVLPRPLPKATSYSRARCRRSAR
jgi:hypothetical protein